MNTPFTNADALAMTPFRTGTKRIVADHRERGSGVPDLLAGVEGVDLTIAELKLGDYLIEDRVLVERKTISDFAASIIDTRLFRQASRLRRSEYRGVFLIEGTFEESEIRVLREAMQGALICVALVFDIPTLRSVDRDETARLLVYAATQLAGQEQRAAVWHHRKPRKLWTRKLDILQRLPGVGRERASRLLERFGTVERCFLAAEAELCEVPGVGPKTARRIRELLTSACGAP
jgi:ERCC4-type nuclease